MRGDERETERGKRKRVGSRDGELEAATTLARVQDGDAGLTNDRMGIHGMITTTIPYRTSTVPVQ
jgi:hypothetical protein